jgi:maltose alpha-D-glucosyltransferase / alpha-amylase
MRNKLNNDPFWYKDAIFYEIYIRGFYDSDANGIGDFRELTEKLDYLEWLGIDCICLSPMYASPLRDDGYDISDYCAVLPEYGSLDDFKRFLDAAHKRGIRVIADLVLNHTSDRHPWFEESRSSPDSPKRDWYVWSERYEKYVDAGVIFAGAERSNWTWDQQAGAFYRHRFFSHQPDLNYDNPQLQQDILHAISFWMELGVDGFRLGAVPYLYERDGANCENLPETHAFLKQIRSFVDNCYPGRVLLTEANPWPEDIVAYFGNGDEFHMAYQFQIVKGLFITLQREDYKPIVEILERTPAIPDICQWGLLLRKQAELNLELNLEYVNDQSMSYNTSIRRRLAPLMENDRHRIELIYILLLSLPGSPILYYGDEIGMGDNIFLGERDSARTPMQWSADRNAGFSKADSAQLYLPINIDPVYGYEMVNVEAQVRLPTSLLHWVRRAIFLRKQHSVFGRGSFENIKPDNRKIFAFARSYRDETVICVYNLSRSSQPVEVDLSHYEGYAPMEMFGQARFPRIEKKPYQLSFNEYGFFWLLIHKDDTKQG